MLGYELKFNKYNMCNIAYVKVTKNSNFLLKTTIIY
jgi:hypothetical protein